MLQRAWRLGLALGVVAALAAGRVDGAPAAPLPDIVVILADDLGYGDLSCQGATDLRTGFQVLFVDAKEAPRWAPRPGSSLVHTPIRAIHCLASAALPLLFPPIQVGDRLLVDGGLRMNTPLRPGGGV